LSIEAARQ